MRRANYKLELTWVGKYESPQLEPQTLIEEPQKSFPNAYFSDAPCVADNKLIFGDNLLALKALLSEYRGKVRCIYIDPPYNIGVAGVPYEDNMEESLWLSMMQCRLDVMRDLLADDGIIFVQIDDEMFAYLSILMDEVFGKTNRMNVIAVKMSEASGVKMSHVEKRLPKLKEYILVYKKNIAPSLQVEKIPATVWNNEYKTLLVGITKEQVAQLKALLAVESASQNELEQCLALLKNVTTIKLSQYFKIHCIKEKDQNAWKLENAWRIIQAVGSSSVLGLAKKQPHYTQEIAAAISATKLLYLYKTGFSQTAKQPRIQIVFAEDHMMKPPGDFWADIKTTGGVGREGGVLFPKSKKPEALLKRIIGMCTQPGDLVLDAFAGSGTTGAVAHKMGRRWIMIEMGAHCHTHVIPRIQNVINGKDMTGITKAVNWQGGGSFRYYKLGLSN